MSWDKVTIQKWYAIERARDKKDPLLAGLSVLSIVSGVDYDKILDSTPMTVAALQNKYKWIAEEVPTDDSDEWNGYKLCNDMSKINTGQFIDLMELAKRNDKENLHYMMAVICRKKGDKRPLQERADELKETMPITIALAHTGFFLRLSEMLQNATLIYTRRQTRKMKKQLRAVLRQTTNGSSGWRGLLQRAGLAFGRLKNLVGLSS